MGAAVEVCLTRVATRRHRLGLYRGASSGFDDESRALVAAYFHTQRITASPAEVTVFCGGFKGAFLCACAAVMCRRRGDEILHGGGVVLAPSGFYQSLRNIPPIFEAGIEPVHTLDGDTVAGWLTDTAKLANRLVYVPLVNNLTGEVLTRDRAEQIAGAVLVHNLRHPGNPVHVVADDVYAGSYLDQGLTPLSVAAVRGVDLGEPGLGAMSDWTVSVVSPSKTVALPTARIAFAASTNPHLRAAMDHYRTVFSFSRPPQWDELTGVVALCLTSQEWVDVVECGVQEPAGVVDTRTAFYQLRDRIRGSRYPAPAGWMVCSIACLADPFSC